MVKLIFKLPLHQFFLLTSSIHFEFFNFMTSNYTKWRSDTFKGSLWTPEEFNNSVAPSKTPQAWNDEASITSEEKLNEEEERFLREAKINPPSLAKAILVMTTISWIGGLAFVVLSVYFLTDKSSSYSWVITMARSTNSYDSINLNVTILYLTIGSLLLVSFALAISFLKNDDKSQLIAYVIITYLIFGSSFGFALTAFMKWSVTNSDLKNTLQLSLSNSYVGIPYSYTQSNLISLNWDIYMIQRRCCGLTDASDFSSTSTVWYNGYRNYVYNNSNYNMTIPIACCEITNSQSFISQNEWQNYKTKIVIGTCPLTQTQNVNLPGCYSVIGSEVEQFIYMTSLGFLSTLLFLFIGATIGSCYLCRWEKIHVEKRREMLNKIKEKENEANEAEEAEEVETVQESRWRNVRDPYVPNYRVNFD